MPTQDDEVFTHRHRIGHFLIEGFAVGTHVDNFVVEALAFEFGNAVVNRLYRHDHTCAAAKRIIVYTFLFIGGIVTQIVNMYFNQAFVYGAFHDRGLKRTSQ